MIHWITALGRLRTRTRLAMVALAIMVVLSFTPIIRQSAFRRLGHWLDVGQLPRNASAIMILGGDRDTRPFAAAQLFRQGIASRIIFSPEKPRADVSQKQMTEQRRVSLILETCGVPQNAIEVFGGPCVSTFDEAKAAAQWLRDHPQDDLIVVTNNYHTRRTRWVFGQVAPLQRIQFVSAPTDGYGPDNWWLNQEGFALYFGECLKFLLYVFLYGWGWCFVLVGAIVCAIAIRRPSFSLSAATAKT
jgi:uncharacterized SAM-binding protein YcdF (DUF218 family)